MIIPEKDELLRKSATTISEISDMLAQVSELSWKDLEPARTVLVIVDMVNGFAREGALMSPRVEKLIPDIAKLMTTSRKLQIPMIAFADCHTEESPEFSSYPPHCMKNTSEGDIVEELKECGGYLLIPKNSTNGFHEEVFLKWLKGNIQITNYILVGDCTDICIQQFAVTLKTWFNMQNKEARIIVPMNAVDTYELGMHDGNLMNIMALYNMTLNGIELVAKID